MTEGNAPADRMTGSEADSEAGSEEASGRQQAGVRQGSETDSASLVLVPRIISLSCSLLDLDFFSLVLCHV